MATTTETNGTTKKRGRAKMTEAEKAAAKLKRENEAKELDTFLGSCRKSGGVHKSVADHIDVLRQDMANLEQSYKDMESQVRTSIKFLRANPPR